MPPFAQIDSLATWLVHPGLFLAGAAATLVPILVHLLNRRRFRVVDWAAMEFLVFAEKKNRRRIRLEDLLLLMLRCLAVFLIGLLLARPFLPVAATAGLIDTAQFERIVILDDSLSMQASLASESVWERAKRRLAELTGALARERADDSLTLIVTSQPDRRLLNGSPLNPSTMGEINGAIERLEVGNGVAQLDAVLHSLAGDLSSQPANVNRFLYLFTDLCRRDWAAAEESGFIAKLIQLAKKLQGCYVIDVGEDDDRNLTITQIRPEGMLVQGVASALDVSVKNQGSVAASGILVHLAADDGFPLETTIERLAPGETTSVRFNIMLAGEPQPDENASSLPARRIKTELRSGLDGGNDRLAADNVAYFAARLSRGISTLLVDGDPSTSVGRAESFYLRKALAPAGAVSSGVVPEVITADEFQRIDLDHYEVVFLLNNDHLGDKTVQSIERLEKWVAGGGGLVIMPGDQIDPRFFNAHFWRNGQGLSPLKLQDVRGDERQKSWVHLRVADVHHDLLQHFAGQNNPLLENVKVFRWWGATAQQEPPGGEVAILATMGDADDSPAIAERPFGKGRVVAFAFPADADWHNWTSEPSYVLMMQDLVRYLASERGSRGMLRIGEPIRQPVDLAQYELNATLSGPKQLKANLQATAPAQADPTTDQEAVWQVEFPAANSPGFYELKLARRDGGTDTMLFAANVDPGEGDLQRFDPSQLERRLAGTNVRLITQAQSLVPAAAGQQTEVWWYLLWLLVAVLSGEQVLGWYFGRARS